ncbi:hypothetical protein Bca52824_031739 [Brassica carinata]|uniref:CCAAT-binding factor domain-containing protein n=1 Tax=Brassica carinata TaxID=52824 RepID=A0A8X7SB70_BRACI|nr:hypothetical protein Bca52824_031739 [Brassica carinata]
MASILSKKQKKKLHLERAQVTRLRPTLIPSSHQQPPLLLSFISPESPPQFVVESSSPSFLPPLLPQLPSSSSSSPASSTKRPRSDEEDDDDSSKTESDEVDGDPEVIFKAWLRSKFDEFVKVLLDVLVSQQSEDTLRDIVLGTLMEFVKLLNAGRFHSSIYHRILNAIIHSAVDADMFLDILNSKYFKYIDVRYFTYISMEKFVKTLEASALSADKTVMENSETENESKDSLELSIGIYQVLSRIPPPQKQAEKSDLEMWSGSDESSGEKPKDKKKKSKDQDSNLLSPTTIAKRMKLKFTKAWISFQTVPLDVYKEVLASIHQTVIPHLSNPAMLCDFLTKSYDIGGVVSVMALSSLFILMTEHGLEYPNFTLYVAGSLVFVAKHRARFLQLLGACLRSSLLPAYLAASFAKKLSRLSLSVPPGSLVITALIYNLLRRHPTINHLVHQEPVDNANEANSEAEEDNESSRPKTNKSLGRGFPVNNYFNVGVNRGDLEIDKGHSTSCPC